MRVGSGIVALGLALLLTSLTGCQDHLTGPDQKRVGAEGGTTTLAEGAVSLAIPPGALSQEVWFTAAPATLFPASDLLVAGTTWEVGPPGTGFAYPATLTLSYDPASLPEGIGATGLALYQVIGTEWVLLEGGSVNTGARTVSAEVRTLGRVGVLGVPVASVDITCPSSVMEPGESIQLTATPRGADGRSLTDRAVTWSSSDEAVATVDAQGVVTGMAEGMVEVKAEAGGESGEAELQVSIPVASVEIAPESGSLKVGQTLQLVATVTDAHGNELTGRTVTWSSSQPSVATVDDQGLLSAVATGSTAVSATVEEVSATVTVLVHAELRVLTRSLADGMVGSSYSQTLAATGGNGTYQWAVSQGSLAPGLSLDPGTGVISGTPASEGTTSFTVQALSANQTATRELSVTITPVPVASVEVTPSSASLKPGETIQLSAVARDAGGDVIQGRTVDWSSSASSVATVSATGVVNAVKAGTAMINASVGGQSAWSQVTVHDELAMEVAELEDGVVDQEYSQTLSAVGGDGTYSWLVTFGTLPPGLTLDATTGSISGTPTAADTFAFTVQVTSGDAQTASAELSILILDELEVSTTSLPTGVVGSSYSQTLEASGGDGEYAWSITDGGLPVGLSLNESSGLISGTPTADGTASFVVKVTSGDEQEATRALTLEVSPLPVASVEVTPTAASLTPGASVLLTATPRSASGTALAGRAITWSSSNAAVARVATNGLVEGVAVGSATITARVEGHSATATITVHGALAVSTSSLAGGTVGSGYSQTLAASGGNGAYTWSVTSGSLPAGLSLASSTGVISGTPTAAGTSTFTVRVESGDGQSATKELTIVIS